MSAAKNDGGPALPTLERGGAGLDLTQAGMSLRDYFAAHAPADIPAWFCYGDDLPPIPSIPHIARALEMQPGFAALSETDKGLILDWMRDGSYDMNNQDLQAIGQAAHQTIDDARQARRDAEEWREAERYFAWRWHYADAMLEARK